jgi:hypothetical protein
MQTPRTCGLIDGCKTTRTRVTDSTLGLILINLYVSPSKGIGLSVLHNLCYSIRGSQRYRKYVSRKQSVTLRAVAPCIESV